MTIRRPRSRDRLLQETGRVGSAGSWRRGSRRNSTIPGVEVFQRKVFHQRYRGYFAEFAREGESVLGKIGLWPKQWATAKMFAGTSKGFHIHPPHIPEGHAAGGVVQETLCG